MIIKDIIARELGGILVGTAPKACAEGVLAARTMSKNADKVLNNS